MKKSAICLILVVCCGFAVRKLTKIKIADGITVSLPNDWQPMDAMDFSERFPSVRAPLGAYTNAERSVDFSANISATQWPDADVTLARQFFKASLMNMFDKVEILSEGIRESHGKKFIYFEFNSRVNGSKKEEALRDPVVKYTYIEYLVETKRTLVFSFSCPKRLQEEWQPTAHKIIASIRVK